MDLLIKNIKGLAQVREIGVSKVSGPEMAELPIINDAFLAVTDGIIESYGPMHLLPVDTAPRKTIDAADRFVLPSFVDSHTHLIFAAYREEEFVKKINGASYAEIAAGGGGILNSARKLQQTSEGELFDFAMERVNEIIGYGTGAVEIKSGYGLTVEDELKMLRVARKIGRESPLTVKTTLLGAHAIPQSYTHRQGYIDLVINEMIPKAAEQNLADYVDVFCEEGFFTPEETISIAKRGNEFGLKPRIHENQLNVSGGVQAGVLSGAISVDHLERMGQEEIDILLTSDTMPTALPGAAFFLRTSYPPAREMISAGLPLAIATDYNPGSAPCGSIPMMMSLACVQMRMTPMEALNAVTINTAYALELDKSHGSITKGKKANLIVTDKIPSLEYIPYSFGKNCIDQVILDGKVIR